MDDDDVIDYMILEAVGVKAAKENLEVEKKAARKDWKKDPEALNRLKQTGG